MSEGITTVNSEIGDDKKILRKEYILQLKAACMSYHWVSCHDLTTIMP